VPFQHLTFVHRGGDQDGIGGVDREDKEMAWASNRSARHSRFAELDVVNEVPRADVRDRPYTNATRVFSQVL